MYVDIPYGSRRGGRDDMIGFGVGVAQTCPTRAQVGYDVCIVTAVSLPGLFRQSRAAWQQNWITRMNRVMTRHAYFEAWPKERAAHLSMRWSLNEMKSSP